MRKSLTKRLRVTKKGKVLYRAMGQGHFRSKRTSTQARRKQGDRKLGGAGRILSRHL